MEECWPCPVFHIYELLKTQPAVSSANHKRLPCTSTATKEMSTCDVRCKTQNSVRPLLRPILPLSVPYRVCHFKVRKSHLEICPKCSVTVSRLTVPQIAKSLIIFSLKRSLASWQKHSTLTIASF